MKVSIIGATGYTGAELIRLLTQHPQVEVEIITSNSFVGKKISDIYPNLTGIIDMKCKELNVEEIAEKTEVAFTALPHGVSMDIVPQLVERGLKVIDLSGDYRYQDLDTYQAWYKEHSSPELLAKGTYGLAEYNSLKIKDSSLVANPGCYPTASLLALMPLVENSLVEKEGIIVDAKSGTTGAGRKLSRGTHFSETEGNFKAYKVANHRHRSEIEEKLSLAQTDDVQLTFTPHLLPAKRGILATIYADLACDKSTEELIHYYHEFYDGANFVRILDNKLPQLKYVVGSNYCDIGVKVDQERNQVIIISAIDNLIKGSAGQAIQNLNLMAGWDETPGLKQIGMYL
ncbi:N-acetyl-gamma-glutamyl-phosphate reductase [Halanaerobacter jeridensis]|uniref:N-acetyl-gamma-glutamyl-phosphate reductase n=1 Tax=Halanaerobacter jeridensis TaxID=706427 RepID=A0A938XU20_9FIRM|nr:N-acetyl-gamma-glutamyl-phosphate reductase [Halanaerobacter jeridensis]MBM7557909.1 N-acetyl-gamma-glutamyl-phosphate reductase [Halanaerobacter jeridensis]